MNALALGLDRTVLELKMYSREKESVFFSFLFPILLLSLFSVIFSAQFQEGAGQGGMSAGLFFLPGMLSAGVLLTSFQTMALSIATERDDGSLKRLQLDHVDLVFCHRPDANTPIEETVWAMSDLIERGKAIYWGTSEWSAGEIIAAIEIAERHHLRKPVMEQPQYNLLWRDRFPNGGTTAFRCRS